jgi:predicted metal-dependent phosphoesterase TrpH
VTVSAADIDLHLHSERSDGHDTPLAVAHANHHRRAWALTDHDSTAGVQAVRGAPGLVPGVEVTAALDGQEVHIVALGIRLDHAPLQAFLADIRDRRRVRIGRLLDRLPERIRRSLSLADFPAGDGRSLGRAHLARALVRRGGASTIAEVFADWLGDEHTADPELNPFPEPAAVCALIHAADGVAILAHPPVYGTWTRALAVAEACGPDLDGVERDCPGTDPHWTAAIDAEADRRDWLLSRGSDRHRMAHRPLPESPLLPRQEALLERLRV